MDMKMVKIIEDGIRTRKSRSTLVFSTNFLILKYVIGIQFFGNQI